MRKLRVTLLVVMMAVVAAASAQMSVGGMRLGIKGGVNMSNFWGDELSDKNMKIGFHVGVTGDYEFAQGAAIQTGLLFTTKGSKYKFIESDNSNADMTANAMYLQLPIHFAYKVDFTPGTRIVFHAGPYLAYGVGGKLKASGNVGSLSGNLDLGNVFGDNNLLKPFDMGGGIGVGAELNGFVIDLGWDMGFINVSQEEDGNIKTQNAYLSVGYKF